MTRSAIDTIIDGKTTDLGEFSVQRTLPSARRRRVGPFVFFDHMGPADFPPGSGVSVRPHPHIGIATVTYLFEGEIMHRDSLGYVQAIRPGALNWMTAGRGIVHSERSRPELIESGSRVHGIQAWVALPLQDEECDPAFAHYPADALPEFESNGAHLRLIAGEAFGQRSPAETRSPLFYVDVQAPAGATLQLPGEHTEQAVYVVTGEVSVDGEPVVAGQMAVLTDSARALLTAATETRCMLLGGAPLDADRMIWWNFVSSRPERIDQAADDWRAGRFEDVPGENEFIPLPERR